MPEHIHGYEGESNREKLKRILNEVRALVVKELKKSHKLETQFNVKDAPEDLIQIKQNEVLARNGYYPFVRVTVDLGDDPLKAICLQHEFEAQDKHARKYFSIDELDELKKELTDWAGDVNKNAEKSSDEFGTNMPENESKN
ncbi:MAG: hypothetical protein AAB467_01120 [Patescibacteria group bacterium]